MFVVLWLLLQCALAGPTLSEPEAPGRSEATESSDEATFSSRLEEAKRLYFNGETDAACTVLLSLERRLLRGESISRDLRAETLIWLGEVQYKLGRAAEARDAFRWLLQQDPQWPISPYAHPIEVIGEFELVRRQVLEDMARTAPEPPPAPPMPAPSPPLWTWAPLGLPQIAQGRPRAALVLGGLQIGLGAASVGLASHLRAINVGPERHPYGWGEDRITTQVDRRRYGLQWPVTFAFYGTWLASSLEARRHHRRAHAQGDGGSSLLGARPGPAAPQLSVGVGTVGHDARGLVISGGF